VTLEKGARWDATGDTAGERCVELEVLSPRPHHQAGEEKGKDRRQRSLFGRQRLLTSITIR
jgi:hypothetical protein